MARQFRQNAVRMQFLNTVDLWKQQAEQGGRLLDTIRTRLQGEIQNQPSSTSVYDVSTESSQTSTDPSSTTAPTDSTSVTSANQPSNRAFYAIFEKLDEDDIGGNDYPILKIVNDMLDDKGHDTTNKSTMYAAYDKWLHHEAIEGKDEGDKHKEHKGQTTHAILNRAFKSLNRNREKNFTEAGTPRIDAVKDWLEDHEYTVVSTDKIKEAWEDYQESDEDEDKEHKKKTTHAVLYDAFKKLKSHRDFLTEAGTPRIDTVKDWLEKNDYTVVSTDKIKEAWEDYQES